MNVVHVSSFKGKPQGVLKWDGCQPLQECVLSIPEGDILAGAMPARQLRNLQTFIDMRTAELELNWKLCMEGKDVIWIDPIR